MKYRAVANGNVYDEAEVPEDLRGSVFVPVEESDAAEAGTPMPPDPQPEPVAPPPADTRVGALMTPEAGLSTVAHTDAQPVKRAAAKSTRRRRKGR